MILALRTDKSEAELYLLDDHANVIDAHLWEAGRQLSQQLLAAIRELLKTNNAEYASLTGLIAWQGPGSFTGLRIGLATANALAYGLAVPIVGTTDDGWLRRGVELLHSDCDLPTQVLPEYGAEATVTKAKK